MTTGSRKVHDFCWINLMTPHAAEAKAFYAGLLGWSYAEMPGVPGGTLIQVEGKNAGALMDLSAPNMPPGIPPVVGAMVRVEDAEATAKRVVAMGGKADPVLDAMENGRMCECTDPNGAVFWLWQPKKQIGFEHDSHAHGGATWFETLTSDADRAVRFYAELFGWTPVPQPMPGGGVYTVFQLDGVPVAGAMGVTPQMGDVPPHWSVVFAVKNADEAASKATALGGTICMGVHEFAGVGRFVGLSSPQGVPFTAIQWA